MKLDVLSFFPREGYNFFNGIDLSDRKYFVSNPRYVIEEAMTNDMLDEQINFMHDCSRSVIEEL